jgi:hypothetical protein
MAQYNIGIVRSIKSGDTLMLGSTVNSNVPPIELSLAFVDAPRLKKDADEVRIFIFNSNA